MARRVNPLRRAAASARRAISRLQTTMSGQPAYQREDERAGVYFQPQSGREAARWTTGDEKEKPNAKDLYYLYNIAGRFRGRKGFAVIVSGIMEGDYPGHEGEAYTTLGFRMNERRFRVALDNPANINALDIVNQFSEEIHGVRWETVYEVSIIYEGI